MRQICSLIGNASPPAGDPCVVGDAGGTWRDKFASILRQRLGDLDANCVSRRCPPSRIYMLHETRETAAQSSPNARRKVRLYVDFGQPSRGELAIFYCKYKALAVTG